MSRIGAANAKFICGSETRNVSGDRHSQIPSDNHPCFFGHLVQGMEGWVEHHASDSEAIVKAENHSIDQTLEQLQVSSAEYFKKNKYSENLFE